MSIDFFGDIRGLFNDAGSFLDDVFSFDGKSGSQIIKEGKEFVSSFKDDKGILATGARAAITAFGSNKKPELNSSNELNRGLISTTKPRGDAGQTKATASVDPWELEREWLYRMKNFSSIEKETSVTLGK
jgi:hypothetical protein